MRTFALLLFITLSLSILLPAQIALPGQDAVVIGGIDNRTVNGTHVALATAEIYDQTTHTFSATNAMTEGRDGHSATNLRDGKVLVAGGDGAETDHPVASAEIYNPLTVSFVRVGDMTTARVGHVTGLLPAGKVLLAGGQDANWTNLASAELYNPATQTFSSTGSMTVARTAACAAVLRNGKMLVAGGYDDTELLSSAELYDPSTGTFTPTGSMSGPRIDATAVLLQDGRVLIAGGGSLVGNCSGCSVATAEIYDPSTGQFTTVGSMSTPRRGHVVVLLKNGQVLAAGGIDDDSHQILRSAEVFDPAALTFTSVSGMAFPRVVASVSLLDDGTALISGGFSVPVKITNTAELFDPQTGRFSVTGHMTDARAYQSSNGVPAIGH